LLSAISQRAFVIHVGEVWTLRDDAVEPRTPALSPLA
jgi:hypothetical protein